MDTSTIIFGFVAAIGWILIATFPIYVVGRRMAITRIGEYEEADRIPTRHIIVIAVLTVLGIILASVDMGLMP